MIKVLLFLILSASNVFGGFISYVVKPGEQALRITVNHRRSLRLITFTAEGPQDCTQSGQALFCNSPTIKVQLSRQPFVTIVQGTTLPVGQDFYVAGPAYVDVTTNATQTLFLTVFLE